MPRILLKYPEIGGDSVVPKFENLIVCKSMDFGTGSRSTDAPVYGAPVVGSTVPDSRHGNGAPPGTPKVRSAGIDSLELTKELDCASPKLLSEVFEKPKPDARGVLYFLRPALGTEEARQSSGDWGAVFMNPFLEIELHNVHVTKYELKAGGGDNETCEEQIALSFTALIMKYHKVVDGKKVGFLSRKINVARQQ